MSGFSTFVATVVLPEKPCKFVVPEDGDLLITNLALDQAEGLPSEGRVLVFCSVNQSPPVCVAPFTLGKFESTQTDLRFCYGDAVEFTTKGPAVPVHLSGFLSGGMELDADNGAPEVDVPENEE